MRNRKCNIPAFKNHVFSSQLSPMALSQEWCLHLSEESLTSHNVSNNGYATSLLSAFFSSLAICLSCHRLSDWRQWTMNSFNTPKFFWVVLQGLITRRHFNTSVELLLFVKFPDSVPIQCVCIILYLFTISNFVDFFWKSN